MKDFAITDQTINMAYSFWNTLSGVGAGADTTDKHALKLQNQLDSRYPQPQHIFHNRASFHIHIVITNRFNHFTRKDKLTIWNAAHISRPSNITRVVESH
jgi:hypothetical protein